MNFSKLKVPNTFLLIFYMVIIGAIFSCIMHGSEYLRVVAMGLIFLVFGSIFLILPIY
jgi:hypothetical protein